MKAKVLQSSLAEALSKALRFTTSKAQLPILSNFLLKTTKNALTIQATNLEMAISLDIGANVEKEGVITVPAKTLFDIILNLKEEQVELFAEKEVLTINTEGFDSSVSGLNAADFPEVPTTLSKNKMTLDADSLKSALDKALFAVSLDESRPILTGVLFEFAGSSLNIVATDGFRLSLEKIKLTKSLDKESIVIPKNILAELHKMLTVKDFDFAIDKKASQISFLLAESLISSRLLQGDFPNYQKIIPTSSTTTVNVDKEELITAFKLASVFARDAANVVRMQVGKDKVEIFAESSKSGKQKNRVDAKVEGESIEIAFNCRYLLEILQVIKSEAVIIKLSDQSSPAVFVDSEDVNYTHLVMPVKT